MIYPITTSETTPDCLSIRGIDLQFDLISQRDDELVASGLGFVVHLLLLVGKYFDVSYRYPLVFFGSK